MRYFFDIRDHGDLIRDHEGTEFANLDAARRDAMQAARELMAEALLLGKPVDHRSFEIRDADGHLAEILSFQDAIPPDA